MFMSVNGLHLEQPSAKQEKVITQVNLPQLSHFVDAMLVGQSRECIA